MLTVLALAALTLPDSCQVVREFVVQTAAGHRIAAEVITGIRARARPTVLLIPGAGQDTRTYATDTGSDSPGNAAWAVITRALVGAGYAVIRFDERGTGQSTGDYLATATTATLADDVHSLVIAAGRMPEIARESIALLGFSEGGAIAPLVASRSARVRAVVLLAAPAWTGQRIMDWQHAYAIEHGDWSDRNSTQEKRSAYLTKEHAERVAREPWYRFFLQYDPLPAMRQLRVPALILQGQQDVQVTPEQAEELAAATRQSDSRRVTVVYFPQLDHTFETLPRSTYRTPFRNEVVETVVTWLRRELPGRPELRACGVRPGAT